MWIKASGQISEVTYHVATPVSSHLVFAGEFIALVDSGLSGSEDLLSAELATLLGDVGGLDYLFLTHCHFDHIGGIPGLRKQYPEMKVVGSPLTAEMIKNEELRQAAFQRNVECAAAMGKEIGWEYEEWAAALTIDKIVGDGDVIDLGGDVEVKVVGCPGHSPELNAYYVPFDAALAAGEAIGGYGGRDKYHCCFRSNYTDYLDSLHKLGSLEVRLVGLPHAGVLTGQLAQRFVLESHTQAEAFYAEVKERIGNGELLDEIVELFLPEWQAELVYPEGPFAKEQEESIRDMVKAVAEA
jgi:glyoxylase-like metal-dependent hydrolase (beta-lactamase superfamily II)